MSLEGFWGEPIGPFSRLFKRRVCPMRVPLKSLGGLLFLAKFVWSLSSSLLVYFIRNHWLDSDLFLWAAIFLLFIF